MDDLVDDGEEDRVGKALEHRAPQARTDSGEPLGRRGDVGKALIECVDELGAQPGRSLLVLIHRALNVLLRQRADDEARGHGTAGR